MDTTGEVRKSMTTELIKSPRRLWLLALAVVGLGAMFLFQGFDWLSVLFGIETHPYAHFAVKRFMRLFINDSFMLLLIYAWFDDKSITQLAWKLQLVDTFILLPLYLVIKLYLEGDSEISSPLLSQFHRLIVNPTLMILLIPGVYFQRMSSKNQKAN
jgi:exosortase F-associated protein